MNDTTNNVESIFKKEIQPPFFYNLQLDTDNSNKLFEFIKNIFIRGLVILYGNGFNIDISQVTLDMINKVSEYMLSIGIKVYFKKMNPKEKDYLYKSLLYDIEKIQETKITIQSDWKTGIIYNININLENNMTDSFKKIQQISKNHFKANHYLKLYKPQLLRDFAIIININTDDESIIYFDYANIGDYRK